MDGEYGSHGCRYISVSSRDPAYCGSLAKQDLNTADHVDKKIFDMFYVHDRGRMLSVYLFGQQLGSMCASLSLFLLVKLTLIASDSYLVALLPIQLAGDGANTSVQLLMA